MQSIIDKWASAVAEVASKAFEVSASISNHSDILGDARESFIRDVLSKFLPATVHVGTGQIVDAGGNTSKQIDVVIYRKDFPILRSFGNADVYLVEGVLATIEVKSTLDKAKLVEALDNGRSVKDLRIQTLRASIDQFCQHSFGKSFDDLDLPEINSLSTWLLPPHYVFAYRGYTEKQAHLLAKHVDAWTSGFPLEESDETDVADANQPTPDATASAGSLTHADIHPQVVPVADIESPFAIGEWGPDDLGARLERVKLMATGAIDAKDPSVLPHVIATQGAVGVLNLNNVLGLTDERFAFGVRPEQNPLRVLISHLLTTIFERMGWHQLGASGIQYALGEYSRLTSLSDSAWQGCVENYFGIRDAKQLLADRVASRPDDQQGEQ
ncbi:DUF6602 domain-containing protein [Burkholderia stagnalis]|uniref:DUF6602 domain-containing protein n=1 Tax=Burkholderia stagnalis TaxID=1503054 RepID=UPI00075FCC84|nr:DUF6602 domain-containing protein [Burkholderia stagnalis]KWK67573.1 hypothetical protein WT82_18155 [Burkholderia stagnalis]